MTQQYLRKVRLIVGGTTAPGVATNPDDGIDLSELHIRFQVRNTTAQTLKRAEIRIYNLNQDTARKIQNEFTRVELSAGYGDEVGLIFQGQIAQIQVGRENATDSYVHIFAQDGDAAYNFATTNRTLAKGWTPDQLYSALLQDLSSFGVTAGYKPDFSTESASRGMACYGMTRDHLRNLAEQQGCEWSIEDGKLNFVKLSSFLPGEAVVLNSASGMIGTPEMTIQGLVVRSLLNSNIKSGGQIKIDNASIASLKINIPYAGNEVVPGTDADGYYTSRVVQHVGDTRGLEWYTSMICVAVDGTAPAVGPTIVDVPNG
ncbi:MULTISPECIES: hypothetical protein [unclassified Rhodanobacter]|uniref:phage protein n=1 Tax=unclassified Rhodanobacter TaxID=2621553 RepID=UPI001BDE8975|nr:MULTISPECIES: hypothetical protein [unclassified Rhodanobacter]MBT2142676.1 hypothetical protein [Rhodanobacter sp. LX-99]MBT2148251.1 hypothetical protein [Rhodanobacter sp. LX-100]